MWGKRCGGDSEDLNQTAAGYGTSTSEIDRACLVISLILFRLACADENKAYEYPLPSMFSTLAAESRILTLTLRLRIAHRAQPRSWGL